MGLWGGKSAGRCSETVASGQSTEIREKHLGSTVRSKLKAKKGGGKRKENLRGGKSAGRCSETVASGQSTEIREKHLGSTVRSKLKAKKGGGKRKENLHPLLDTRGNTVTKNQDKAEVLSAFFASVFTSKTSCSLGTQLPALIDRDGGMGNRISPS